MRFAFAAVFFRFRLKSKCYVEDLSSINACKDLKYSNRGFAVGVSQTKCRDYCKGKAMVLDWNFPPVTPLPQEAFRIKEDTELKDLILFGLFRICLLSCVDICSLYRGILYVGASGLFSFYKDFVITRFFPIHSTVTLAGLWSIFRFTEDFARSRNLSGRPSFI